MKISGVAGYDLGVLVMIRSLMVLTSLSGNPLYYPIKACHTSAAAARIFITSAAAEEPGGS
jgi:hypothetical protein